ncbi:MAG: hypothetical protein HQK52_15740 [Oligoflexia bacterium]|nr:hypothetical protein [Oligoflexia bacterium]
MKLKLGFLAIALIIPVITQAVVGRDYSELRKALKNDIIKWNKGNSGLAHLKEFSDRFTALAKLRCGEDYGTSQCQIGIEHKTVISGTTIWPYFKFSEEEDNDVQADLGVIIPSLVISDPEVIKELNFRCTDNTRLNYEKKEIKVVNLPKIVNPFDSNIIVQEESIRKFSTITGELDKDFYCQVHAFDDDNREPVVEGTSDLHVIEERINPSRYLKINDAGECTILDEITGTCKVSEFFSSDSERDKEIYSVKTLRERETENSIYYDSSIPLREGIYEYIGDHQLRRVNDRLLPKGECKIYVTRNRPKDSSTTPTLLLEGGILKSCIWKGNRLDVREVDIADFDTSLLANVNFNKNAFTILNSDQCDLIIKQGGHDLKRETIAFKPEENYFMISYAQDVPAKKRVNDLQYHTIIESIDFEDQLITPDLFEGLDIKALARIKQIVVANWEQLTNITTMNFIKQKFVGIEKIKIKPYRFFPEHPGTRSNLLLSAIEKFEHILPMIEIETPPIPISLQEHFYFKLGDDSNSKIKYAIAKEYGDLNDNNFDECLNLNRSKGANDLQCHLNPSKENRIYELSFEKSDGNKKIKISKKFIAKYKKCKTWQYNEGEGDVCGVKEYNSREDATCGYAYINTGTGPECGVHHYLTGRGAVCGVENYKNGKNMACGADLAEVPSLTIPVGTEHAHNVNWSCKCRGYDEEIGDWTDVRDGFRILVCGKIKSCRHPENGVESYRECAHAAFGTIYNSCQHTNFGFKYNTCANAAFGIKSFNKCRHESFGKDKCVEYEK